MIFSVFSFYSPAWRRLFLLACVAILSTALCSAASEDRVLVIPLHGPINQAQIFFLRRALQTARATAVKAVVIDMDTPGGRLQETEEIIAWIRALDKPVYAFVNTHAQSAGAIICLACDAIYMAPGSRIGSAAPILLGPLGGGKPIPNGMKEKLLSDMRAMTRTLAQENGYLPELAMAMVDADVEVKVGKRVVSPKGQLVNLTARDAIEIIPPRTKPLLATAIVPDIEHLLKLRNQQNLVRVRMEPSGFEKLAGLLLKISPILLAIAALGLFVEFKTPGFGIPGLIGIGSLGLFLFGYHIAGLTGYGDLLLIGLGILLIGLEVFVIPGFGVCGILGICCFMAGIVMSMIPRLHFLPQIAGSSFSPQSFQVHAMSVFLITVGLIALGGWALARILPKTSIYSDLVLNTAMTTEAGYVGVKIEESAQLLDAVGVALSTLRPAGIARIAGKRIDVVSSGDYIEKGETIRVVDVQGSRVVVVQVPAQSE